MVWDILPGDDEWVAVSNAYLDYINNDIFCAAPEAYGLKYDKSSFYSIYKWIETKAKLYVELIGNPSCLKENYYKTPLFADYSMYWRSKTLFYLWPLLILLLYLVIIE